MDERAMLVRLLDSAQRVLDAIGDPEINSSDFATRFCAMNRVRFQAFGAVRPERGEPLAEVMREIEASLQATPAPAREAGEERA